MHEIEKSKKIPTANLNADSRSAANRGRRKAALFPELETGENSKETACLEAEALFLRAGLACRRRLHCASWKLCAPF